ncbi:MAG: CYTH domain-containing protein [Patescibacteria group bacterium]
MNEIEIKILNINPRQIEAKLKKLGAKKIFKGRLKVKWFSLPHLTNPNKHPWFLRIRTTNNKSGEITWKSRPVTVGLSRKHREINLPISNHDSAADLFLAIGLKKYAYQEKDRTSWKLQDWQFDLDKYPKIPPYLEIEGRSAKHINEAIKLLGLTKCKTSAEGERTLITKEYKLNWFDMRF